MSAVIGSTDPSALPEHISALAGELHTSNDPLDVDHCAQELDFSSLSAKEDATGDEQHEQHLVEKQPPPRVAPEGQFVDDDDDDVLATDLVPTAAQNQAQQQQQQQQQPQQQPTRSSSFSGKVKSSDVPPAPHTLIDPSRPKRTPKLSCYARLVGKRREAISVAEDPSSSSSMLSWAREKVLGLVAGETAEERKTRLRLNWYRQILQAELEVVEKARQHFSNHGKNLAVEFELQELQLQKWGLLNILPAFRMQAWARVSRSALLEDIAFVAERILKLRLSRAQDVIALYASDSKGDRKHPLDSYNAFCLDPEQVMAKEPALTHLGHRLQRMDKVCNMALHIFKTMLPELESRTFVQRKHMLADIMTRYAQLIAITEPASLEESMCWTEFCDWYALRHTELAELEREFGNFVEDEREREGRLFRRWCTMTLLPDETLAGEEEVAAAAAALASSASTASSGFAATPRVAQEPTQAAIKTPKMSPRSIIAFIRHFAVNVIAAKYNTPLVKHETLVALTESLVYRRINSCVLRYPTAAMQERDVAWRSKCSLCRFVNPVTFGVPNEYAFGSNAPPPEPPSEASEAAVETEQPDTESSVSDGAGGGGIKVDRSSSGSTIDFNLVGHGSKDDGSESDKQSRSSDKASALSTGSRKRFGVTGGSKDSGGGGGRSSSGSCSGKSKSNSGSNSNSSNSSSGSSGGDEGGDGDWVFGDLSKKVSFSARLQTLPEQLRGGFGAPYAHASRVLSLLSTSLTPREITHNLLLALKWLLKDAVELSGKRDYLGADLMFPILVLVLINAQIPCMHLVLHFLHKCGQHDVQGEAAYYITCLEAAVAFVLRIDVPSSVALTAAAAASAEATGIFDNNIGVKGRGREGASGVGGGGVGDEDGDRLDDGDAADDDFFLDNEDDNAKGRASNVNGDADSQLAEMDMNKLCEWLRDQQTMEETIEILQSEGWMV